VGGEPVGGITMVFAVISFIDADLDRFASGGMRILYPEVLQLALRVFGILLRATH
jgi:hypothetical protein